MRKGIIGFLHDGGRSPHQGLPFTTKDLTAGEAPRSYLVTEEFYANAL
jgi:hypothetical protein